MHFEHYNFGYVLWSRPRQALTAGIDTAGILATVFASERQPQQPRPVLATLSSRLSVAANLQPLQEYIRTDTATLTSISAKLAGGPS